MSATHTKPPINPKVTAIVTLIGVGLMGCTGVDDFEFGDSFRGVAALDGPDRAQILVARPQGYKMRRMATPYDSSEELYTSTDGMNSVYTGPKMFVEPGGSRAVVDGLSFPLQQGALFDVGASGPTPILPGGDYSELLDVHYGTTNPFALIYPPDYTIRLLQGPANPGASWFEVAGTTDANCVAGGVALAVEGNGNAVTFCGGKIMTVGTGFDLVVDTSGQVAFSLAADGIRNASGAASFFYLAAADGGITNLERRVRNPLGGGWTSEHLAVIPGVPYEDSHLLAAGGENSVAVIQKVCDTTTSDPCKGELHAAWLDGATWRVEHVATLEKDHGIEGLTAAGAPPVIMTGTINLMIHRRTGTTWSSEELGTIGADGDGSGASCAVGSGGTPLAAAVFLGITPLVLAFARRRRRP